MNDAFAVKTHTFEKLVVRACGAVDPAELDLMDLSATVRRADWMVRDLIVELQAYVWSQDLETKEIPSGRWVSWWDHLRADHFPAWANRRWPPRTEGVIRVSGKALYPELSKHLTPGGRPTLQIHTSTLNLKDLPRG